MVLSDNNFSKDDIIITLLLNVHVLCDDRPTTALVIIVCVGV